MKRRIPWVTLAIWGVGIGLQFAAPLLRDRVQLSDAQFIGSIVTPWWHLAQLVGLAAILALARRRTAAWPPGWRALFGVFAALVMLLFEPDLWTYLANASTAPVADLAARALVWSTPLAFYVVPAAIVVLAWLRRDPRMSMPRALGVAFVFIGLVGFPYILWLNHLWDLYIRTSGGGPG